MDEFWLEAQTSTTREDMRSRCTAPRIEALIADCEAGRLARAYGIHRTPVSAHVAWEQDRGRPTEAQTDGGPVV